MKNSPRALAFATVALWGFGSAVTKTLSLGSVFFNITFSILLSALSFAFLVRWNGRGSLSVSPAKAVRYALIGLFGYGLYWICYTQSFRHSQSAATSAVLNYTWPLFTVIFTEFLNRSETDRFAKFLQWSGIVLGTVAVWILVTHGDLASLMLHDPAAVSWGLGAGISYGLFGALSSSISKEEQLIFLFYASAGSAIFLAPLVMSEFHSVFELSLSTFLVILASGVLLDCFGYYCWTMANRLAREQSLDIAKVSSITLALPFLSTLIISIIFGEKDLTRPYFIVAVALLTLSSGLCQLGERIASYFDPEPKVGK